MIKTLLSIVFCCIFATFLQSQTANPPVTPEIHYVSTTQVLTDEVTTDTVTNYILVKVSKKTIRLESENWIEDIPVKWEKDGEVYTARTEYAKYIIFAKQNETGWTFGNLIEYPTGGVDYIIYKRRTP